MSQAMAAPALVDRSALPASSAPTLETRVVEALCRCVARWGIGKTTADDLAREAGVSRATLYRAFPGGKDVIIEVAMRHEAARFFATVTDRLDGAGSLEDAVVIGTVEAARFLSGHEALAYLIAHEPHLVLPALAFHRLDGALATAAAFTAPHVRRFVDDDETAAAGAEHLVRLLLSYAINPTPALDLTDEAAVRRFTRTYVLPALMAPAPTQEP